MSRILTTIVSALCLVLCLAHTGRAEERVTVFVSILPQKYFVEKIGGGLVNVHVMVPPGANPATYEPKPRQMVALATADAYFAIGVPFESAWLPKIAAANSKMKLVHTEQGIERGPMVAHHHGGDAAGREAAEGGLDPHIWLSPPLVKIQARTILSTLQEIDPAHRADYGVNYRRFASEIDALDHRIAQILADKAGMQFMVFHPAWGYFARTYHLVQVPVEIEGKNPKPAQLQALILHARKRGIKVVFVQPQFSRRSAALVARAIGGSVAVADPLAEDWASNLIRVAESIGAALK